MKTLNYIIKDKEEASQVQKWITSNKGKNKYDCLIPASGGLDSSYVICYAKSIGLNPLVISYDSSFITDCAQKNLKTICDNLKVDLIVIRSRGWDRKFVKYMIKALKDIGLYWGVCKSCIYMIRAITYREALHRKIPMFFMASNPYEESIELCASSKFKGMLKKFIKLSPLQMFKTLYYILIAEYCFFRLKMEFYAPPITNLFRVYPKRLGSLKWINPENYLKWDIKLMISELEKMGWKRPPHPQLPMRFDCLIERSLMNTTFKNTIGTTIHSRLCNNLICDGVYTKNELSESMKWYEDNLSTFMNDILKEDIAPL